MRAIDTNVLVRLIARDDDRQLEAAEQLITAPFLILPTVVLEGAWVLQSVLGFGRAELVSGLRTLLGNEHAVLVSGHALLHAIGLYAERGDFADALHLGLAAEAGAASFATFDRKFAALPAGDLLPIETLGS